MNTYHDGHTRVPASSGGHAPAPANLATQLDYVAGLLRRRWWVVLACVIGSVSLTWWVSHDSIDMYTAEVLIQGAADDPLFSVGLRGDGGGGFDFGTELEIIRSRAVIAAAVNSLGLQFNLHTHRHRRTDVVGRLEVDRQPRGRPYLLAVREGELQLLDRDETAVVAHGTDRELAGPGFTLEVANPAALSQPVLFNLISEDVAIERLKGRLHIEQGKGAGLIRIRYSDPDPRFAAAVANTVAESYRQYGISVARQQAAQRRDVILKQLAKLADSVQKAQDAMLDYQQRLRMISPSVEGNALLSARYQVENELRSLRFQEGLLRSLTRGLESQDPDIATLQELVVLGRDIVPAGAALHQRLQNLQSDRSKLTASQFGLRASDPRVQVIDSLIAGTAAEMQIVTMQALRMVRAQIEEAETRLSGLEEDIGALPTRAAGVARLQQQVDGVQRVFNSMVDQYFEAEIAESTEQGSLNVVDPAYVPLGPDPSMDRLNLFIALLTGLVLGGIGAAGVDAVDRRVRSAKEAGHAAQVAVLGTIPHFTSLKNEANSTLLFRDSLHGIWTNLRFIRPLLPNVLAVTSSVPGEGKTTVASNLALALAEQGMKVLLVDGDVRRPMIHTIFDVDRRPGLTEVLRGDASLDCALRSALPGAPTLSILTSGGAVDDPATLFSGPRFRSLISLLRSEYELVLIDIPPILAVVESLPIASSADGALLVVRSAWTDATALADAADQLRVADVPVTGLVMNAVALRQTPYRRYSEYYLKQTRSSRWRAGELMLWKHGSRKIEQDDDQDQVESKS